MQPRNEKFFTLFSKAGSNVIVSAAILMEFVATGLGALVVRRLGKRLCRATCCWAAVSAVGDASRWEGRRGQSENLFQQVLEFLLLCSGEAFQARAERVR